MMALQIFSEWLASFVEVLLYFYIIDSISYRRFDKKKQVRFWLIFAGAIAYAFLLSLIFQGQLPTALRAVAVAVFFCVIIKEIDRNQEENLR